MKMLKNMLVAAGLALAVGSVATTADAQPRYNHTVYGNGYHHDRYANGHGDRRNWGNHHRRCRTEYRHHHRVTRCW